MKKSWTLISLVAALAVGGASAETYAGTTAGTDIVNQAEITYTPEPTPNVPNPPPSTVTTPPVTTRVQAVPSFAITPNDKSTDPTKPDYTQPGQTKTAKPCDKNVSYLYYLTNTGNVPNESYTIKDTPPTISGVSAPENVRFAIDSNGDGQLNDSELAAATTTLTVTNVQPGIKPDGTVDTTKQVKFFQIYDMPCNVKDGDKVGGDPTGDRNPQSDPKFNPVNPADNPKTDGNNSNVTTVDRKDGVVIGPKEDPDGNGNPVTPPYTSPSPENFTITPSASDSQTALVPTLSTTTSTTVTFTNTFQNTGNRTDTFELTQTNNFPANTTVEFKDMSGNPLPVVNGKPVVKDVPASGLVSIKVVVTLPAGTTPVQMANEPFTTITITSTNDPSKSDPTKDIIKVTQPGLNFGDPTTPPGGDPTPVGTPPTNTPGNPGTPIKPGDPAVCTGTVRSFMPMEIKNAGAQSDSYTVTGTAPVTVLKTDGTVNPTPVIVNVVYYLDGNGTTTANGVLDSADTPLSGGNTGTIKPGEYLKLIAVVDVPCAAGKQTITLNQIAKSTTDPNVKVPDTNNTVTVGNNDNKPKAEKSVDKATAKPGETLTYTIIGKNTTNANITKALVCDTLPANTTFVSFSATSTAAGTILYSSNGGTSWSSVAPTSEGTKLCAAVNTNTDNTIDTSDILKPGETITVTFKVQIK